MASRPVWKGQIRLSLVSIPVEIYAATKSGAQISFRQIHRKSGKRIHYDKVAEGIARGVVLFLQTQQGKGPVIAAVVK